MDIIEFGLKFHWKWDTLSLLIFSKKKMLWTNLELIRVIEVNLEEIEIDTKK